MEKGRDKKFVIIIIVLSLVVFGLVGYLVYDNFIVLKNDTAVVDKEKNNKKDDEAKEVVEEVLTDVEKNDISTKINQILFRGMISEEYVPKDDDVMNSHNFYSDVLLESRVSDEYKALVALNIAKGNRVSIDQEQKSADEVNRVYKNYFGTAWKDVRLDTIISCPTYTYDATNNVYNAYQACGGTSANSIILHKENYKLVDGVASVDLYVATFIASDTDFNIGHISSELAPMYQNIDSSKIIASANSDSERRITDENKAKVNSYKFSFKRGENGNFYFDSLNNNK